MTAEQWAVLVAIVACIALAAWWIVYRSPLGRFPFVSGLKLLGLACLTPLVNGIILKGVSIRDMLLTLIACGVSWFAFELACKITEERN